MLKTLYLMLLALLMVSVNAQAADYAREKKWADEVVPGVVVGDPVYLELANSHKFLTLFTEAPKARAAVIVVHGIGVHPDWGLIGVLRSQLADHGYSTLSVQMPVLANEATGEDYPVTFPEAAERLQHAAEFLRAKGYKKIAIVSHSMGSRMTYGYLLQHQDAPIAAWVAIGMGADLSYKPMKMPVLDLFGQNDLPQVLNGARQRGDSLKGKAKSAQIAVPHADHFFENRDAELIRNVQTYLEKTL
jgi:predicted alpha/beta-hydrolase family hydrolase